MYSGGMTHLPMLPEHVARRPYGNAIQVRAAHTVARLEREDRNILLSIWVSAAVIVAVLIGWL